MPWKQQEDSGRQPRSPGRKRKALESGTQGHERWLEAFGREYRDLERSEGAAK